MAETSGVRDGGLRKFLLYVFFGGWVAAVVVLAVLMRAWIPDIDLKAELSALEEAETDPAEPDAPPSALQPLTGPLPTFVASGSSYMPLYASLYVGGQRSLNGLSATLSLRNTSRDQAMILTAVTYLDASGKAVAQLFDEPRTLAPMATAEFYIDQTGTPGGPITAVLVDWGAKSAIAPPLVEAVTVGSYGAKSISFITRGEERP